MSNVAPERLRIIAYAEAEGWMAQCLEYDISAQGHDLDEAVRKLVAAVNFEIEYTTREKGEAFAGIPPAPSHFEKMFEGVEQELPMRVDTHEADLRIAA